MDFLSSFGLIYLVNVYGASAVCQELVSHWENQNIYMTTSTHGTMQMKRLIYLIHS